MITAPRNFNELQAPPSIFSYPYHIAAIVNNSVEHIFHVDEDLKDIFLSNPLIKQVEDLNNGGPNLGWIYNASNDSYSNPNPEETIDAENVVLLPYSIVLILDNIVVSAFHIDERLASVLLSNPIFKEVDLPSNGGPDLGWTYNPENNTYSN